MFTVRLSIRDSTSIYYTSTHCTTAEPDLLTFISDDLGRLQEEAAVLQVHHLSLQTVLHHVHESQLVTQVLENTQKTHKTTQSKSSKTDVRVDICVEFVDQVFSVQKWK